MRYLQADLSGRRSESVIKLKVGGPGKIVVVPQIESIILTPA
jgi:hypothetical protein